MVVVVAEAAKKDAAKIASAEVAEELEVAKVEGTVGGEGGGSLDGAPMRVARRAAMGAEEGGRGRGGGGVVSLGGGGEAVVEAESKAAAGQAGAGAGGGGAVGGGDAGEAQV